MTSRPSSTTRASRSEPATTRASFYVYNDLDDIDALTAAVRATQTLFAD